MAEKNTSESDVIRTRAPKGAPDGTPISTTRRAYADPGVDVSNADVDLAAVSLDSSASTYVENPDPNPQDLRPAPGPSTVQVLGTGSDVAPGEDEG